MLVLQLGCSLERSAPDIEVEFSGWGPKNPRCRGHGRREVDSGRNLRCEGHSKGGIAMGWSVDRGFL